MERKDIVGENYSDFERNHRIISLSDFLASSRNYIALLGYNTYKSLDEYKTFDLNAGNTFEVLNSNLRFVHKANYSGYQKSQLKYVFSGSTIQSKTRLVFPIYYDVFVNDSWGDFEPDDVFVVFRILGFHGIYSDYTGCSFPDMNSFYDFMNMEIPLNENLELFVDDEKYIISQFTKLSTGHKTIRISHLNQFTGKTEFVCIHNVSNDIDDPEVIKEIVKSRICNFRNEWKQDPRDNEFVYYPQKYEKPIETYVVKDKYQFQGITYNNWSDEPFIEDKDLSILDDEFVPDLTEKNVFVMKNHRSVSDPKKNPSKRKSLALEKFWPQQNLEPSIFEDID